jgi:tellurite resistance protein TehA-like permease
MLALILFGSMLPQHVRLGWNAGTRRASGGSMVATLVLLALTGYGLYYLVDETQRSWVSVTHWGIGLALLAVALIHVFYRREPVQPDKAHAPRGKPHDPIRH